MTPQPEMIRIPKETKQDSKMVIGSQKKLS